MVILRHVNTIHIDDKHARLLERLLARMSSTGEKINKKDVIEKLIEDAAVNDPLPPQEQASLARHARREGSSVDAVLPIPIPGDEEIQKRFAGRYIATRDGNIVAVDQTLRALHDKCKALAPASAGQGCHIQYIEDGAAVYGLGF
jgi:hypothetical protein